MNSLVQTWMRFLSPSFVPVDITSSFLCVRVDKRVVRTWEKWLKKRWFRNVHMAETPVWIVRNMKSSSQKWFSVLTLNSLNVFKHLGKLFFGKEVKETILLVKYIYNSCLEDAVRSLEHWMASCLDTRNLKIIIITVSGQVLLNFRVLAVRASCYQWIKLNTYRTAKSIV